MFLRALLLAGPIALGCLALCLDGALPVFLATIDDLGNDLRLEVILVLDYLLDGGPDDDQMLKISGYLPGLEAAAVTWQAGQHQPDSLAAVVVAHDVLVHAIGQHVYFVSPLAVARRAREGTLPPPAWMTPRIGARPERSG